jgi:hypothetical protein
MRRSYKTTEFWLAIIFMAAGFGVLVYSINAGADLLGVAAVLGAISTPTVAQIHGRNRVKENNE